MREVKLLKNCLKGDPKAFGVIVETYQELVCAITYSGVADIQKSEELAHQIFINAWNKLSQLRDLTRFRPWLCTIARNRVKSFKREKKRDILQKAKPMEYVTGTPIDEPGPLESAIRKEHIELVDGAIGQIPEEYREPLVLYYRQQQSVRQVALSLDLPEQVVKKRLQRGRKMIKGQISSIVEKTLSATGPKKAFTTAVIASVAGMAIKGSGAAVAAGIGTGSSTTGTATGIAGAMSGVTVKIITAAAVVVVGIGAVVAYKQISKPRELPDLTYPSSVVDGAEEVPVMAEEEAVKPVRKETVVASVADESKTNLKVHEPAVKSVEPEPMRTEDAEFEFKAKGVLSGLITDAVTGEAVTDTRIHISVPKGRVYSTTTDANGFYSFESVDRYGDCRITVFSKPYIGITDYDSERIYLEQGKQTVRHFELLERACQIWLRVVDEAGKPIEKARFVSTWLADKDKRPVGDRHSVYRTDAEGYVLLGSFKPADTPYLITTTRRIDGEMVERNGMMVSITQWDYAPEPIKVILTDPNVIEYREIVLQKGLEVRGYAEYLDGVPAGDVRIGAEPNWWHSHYVPKSYPVDANGYFTLKHIVPETYGIHAHLPRDPDGSGRYLTVKKVELPPKDGELLVVTIPEKSPESLATISGKVVFAGDVKPSHISIMAQSPQLKSGYGGSQLNSGYGGLGQYRLDDLRDEFVIERLEPGVYHLRFSGDQIEEKIVSNVQAPSEGLVIELTARKKVTLKGKVVEKATGEPITDFRVMAYGERDWRQVSDKEGRFDLEVTGSENWKVIVSADGYGSKVSEVIVPDANERMMIELGIGGAIEGRVVDEYGVAIEGASISYHHTGEHTKPITASDANGLFMIDEIPVWEYSCWYVIEHPEYAKELRLIEVDGDKVAEAEIVLNKGGSVEGYVYDEQGRPLAETTVYFMSEPHFSWWNKNRSRLGMAETDEQGYYRIEHLPERLCSGFHGDPDKSNDATLTSILPRNGQVRRLDFGGQWHTAGRLLQDGEPLADTRMMLSGNKAGHETAFATYATTDSAGWFIFRGIPSGRRYLYWSIPGLRSWSQWSEIGLFDFDSGIDVDLGDIEVDLDQAGIEVITEEPNEPLGQGYLVILIVTEDGLPLAGADVWLERGGKTVTPHFDSDRGKSLSGDPGEWILHTEYPGYKPVVQKVTMKSREDHNMQEILAPLVLTMSKQ